MSMVRTWQHIVSFIAASTRWHCRVVPRPGDLQNHNLRHARRYRYIRYCSHARSDLLDAAPLGQTFAAPPSIFDALDTSLTSLDRTTVSRHVYDQRPSDHVSARENAKAAIVRRFKEPDHDSWISDNAKPSRPGC